MAFNEKHSLFLSDGTSITLSTGLGLHADVVAGFSPQLISSLCTIKKVQHYTAEPFLSDQSGARTQDPRLKRALLYQLS